MEPCSYPGIYGRSRDGPSSPSLSIVIWPMVHRSLILSSSHPRQHKRQTFQKPHSLLSFKALFMRFPTNFGLLCKISTWFLGIDCVFTEKTDKNLSKNSFHPFWIFVYFQDNDEWSTRDIRGHLSFIYYLYFCLSRPIDDDYFVRHFNIRCSENIWQTCLNIRAYV